MKDKVNSNFNDKLNSGFNEFDEIMIKKALSDYIDLESKELIDKKAELEENSQFRYNDIRRAQIKRSIKSSATGYYGRKTLYYVLKYGVRVAVVACILICMITFNTVDTAVGVKSNSYHLTERYDQGGNYQIGVEGVLGSEHKEANKDNGNTVSDVTEDIRDMYDILYIPEGFKLDDSKSTVNTLVYGNKDEQYISIRFYKAYNYITVSSPNILKDKVIGDKKIRYYRLKNINKAYWAQEEYLFEIEISDEIYEEMDNIIAGIQEK